MDWATILTSVISALVSGGGLLSVVYYRENKQAKQLDNDSKASAAWRTLYEDQRAKVEKLNDKIDVLYSDNTTLRNENNDLTTINAKLSMTQCIQLACGNREPAIFEKPKIN